MENGILSSPISLIMGNLISQLSNQENAKVNSGNDISLANIPNHLLIDIIGSGLSENDVAAFRSVCRRWNWIVAMTPTDRLPKLHVARLGIDCKFEGDDVIWVRQRNCSTVGFIRGHTKERTLRKLERLACDEFRLSSHQQSSAGGDSMSSSTSQVARRASVGDGDASGYVAVNPTLFTTVIGSSLRTLTRVYVFRCSLFRFTEKDIQSLAAVDHLTTLSICRVSDANAINDNSLLPVINRGTLEKLVLDKTAITDNLLMAVGRHCKKLSLLSVLGCSAVTDGGVAAVSASLLNNEGLKIICRETQFDCMRFLYNSPRFRLSTSGRALELPFKKISIHFV